MRSGSSGPGANLRDGAPKLCICMSNRVVRDRNAETDGRWWSISPFGGRNTESDSRTTTVARPVIFAIDEVVAYFEK